MATLSVHALALSEATLDSATPQMAAAMQMGDGTRGTMVYDDIPASGATGAFAQPVGTEIGDELSLAAGPRWLDSIGFSVYNSSASTATLTRVDMTVKFYQTWAASNLLGSVAFNDVTMSLAPGYYTIMRATGLYAAGIRVQLSEIPLVSLTLSDAQPTTVTSLGQVLYNPPSIGASTDDFWIGPPPGSWAWFSGSPVANFQWEIDTVTPEPSALLLLGLAGLLARRR